ncbi:MAG: hypothetical protein JNK41_00620 [Saprospiraceae bacterium]|jgi:hypothetical protein|nr:hypothetical protein [Saprospiraceae bacterium]
MEQKSTYYRTLLRYIYQETSTQDTQFMAEQIYSNSDVQNEYKDLMSTICSLPKVQMSPERASIQNILHHMRMSSIEAHH